MKGLAYDKLEVARMRRNVLERIENIVGKERNAGYQRFLLPRPGGSVVSVSDS